MGRITELRRYTLVEHAGGGASQGSGLTLCVQSSTACIKDLVARSPPGSPPPLFSGPLLNLHARCADYIGDEASRSPCGWTTELDKKNLSYWGEGVHCAEPVSIDQVEPALPRPGLAGITNLVDVLPARPCKQLQWPLVAPFARRQLHDMAEWVPRAKLLLDRSLCDWILRARVFAPHGTPLTNDLFGVLKQLLRPIFNLVPTNRFFFSFLVTLCQLRDPEQISQSENCTHLPLNGLAKETEFFCPLRLRLT